MPSHKDFSPEDSELLKSICSESEILAINRVLNCDLKTFLCAGDATLSIFTHPQHVALRADLAKIHQRLKFELGILRVVNVENQGEDLQRKYRIRLIPGTRTNRNYIRYFTLMASEIIESHLLRNQ
jgi:hypothetical protein